MNIYYNDDFMNLSDFAAKKRISKTGIMRAFNKGKYHGVTMDGIRLIILDGPGKHWYQYNLAGEKVYLDKNPDGFNEGNLHTVSHFTGLAGNGRRSDSVYDAIILRKVSCYVLGGAIFINSATEGFADYLKNSTLKDKEHRRHKLSKPI